MLIVAVWPTNKTKFLGGGTDMRANWIKAGRGDHGAMHRSYPLLTAVTASMLGRGAITAFALDLAKAFSGRAADPQTMWCDGTIALSALRRQR